MTDPFISASELAQHSHNPKLRIFDASWYLPQAGRDARAEFEQAHLPGAQFFDLDRIKDTQSPLPHMLPSSEDFARIMGEMGCDETCVFVVYDNADLFSAPRARWMLRTFGSKEVFILQGGVKGWMAEGFAIEKGLSRPREKTLFKASFKPEQVASWQDVKAAQGTAQILDARARERFNGEVPEPRPGLKAGHIPGSINLPYTSLIQDGHLKPKNELKVVLAGAGVDLTKPLITTCGSGVTAAIIALAIEVVSGQEVPVYDGSWAEWGSRPDLPVGTA